MIQVDAEVVLDFSRAFCPHFVPPAYQPCSPLDIRTFVFTCIFGLSDDRLFLYTFIRKYPSQTNLSSPSLQFSKSPHSITTMSSGEIAGLEAEVKEYKQQLETIQLGLQNDPDNSELQSLKQEIEEVISLTESAIAELKPAPAPVSNNPSPPPVKQKWSKENHPAYQAGYKKDGEPEESHAAVSFQVNDTVQAMWKSGDRGFYTARITSITGSKHDPVYIVKFQKYGNTETLKSRDIKPLSVEARKRKADGISGSSAPAPPRPNPGVISAAASVDPTLAQQAKREPSKVSDGPIRPAKIPRKVKANKELEAGKASWQAFASKGKAGKKANKDSMFRTGESVNARVGFTGSGQEMRKDVSRSRHIYEHGAEE